MKDMAKDKTLESCEEKGQDNVDDIQTLLSNLSIKKNNLKTKSMEDENNKIGKPDEEEVRKEDDVKEENSEGEASGDDSDDQFNVVLHVPEKDDDVEQKHDSKQREKDDEAEQKESTVDSDSENTDELSVQENGKKTEGEDDKNDIDALKLKLSLLAFVDSSDDEDDSNCYLKRGPLTDRRNHNRVAPFQHSSSAHQQSSLYNSPAHENSNSSMFDVVEFPQLNGTEGLFRGYGLNQSYFENGEGNSSCSPLSPQSVYSPNAHSPFYNTNFSSNQNSNDCQYQNEFSTDQWSNGPTTQFLDSPSYDFENNGYGTYEPLSPPKSVSPFLKDGQDSNQFGNLGENENLKESEDLINIIDSVNKTYNTNAKGIPESELVKLRSVLDGNELSIRNEMGMYLKNDTHFQPSLNRLDDSALNDSASDFVLNYEAPLTPPKSVSPVQNLYSSSSPVPPFTDNRDEHLNDILKGIDEINPDELNIYLDEDTSACDPSYARNVIHSRCKPNNLDHALRRLSSISTKYLCKKDQDGDTCLMIVYSKPEDSQDFYENIFCLQEKVREIRVCCDVPLGKAKRCKVCGNTDPVKFYTPLSLKNKQGDTALSCAVKTDHSPVIISYLLHGILQCPEDFRRVFDERGRAMLADAAYKYPCLNPYV